MIITGPWMDVLWTDDGVCSRSEMGLGQITFWMDDGVGPRSQVGSRQITWADERMEEYG